MDRVGVSGSAIIPDLRIRGGQSPGESLYVDLERGSHTSLREVSALPDHAGDSPIVRQKGGPWNGVAIGQDGGFPCSVQGGSYILAYRLVSGAVV